ncbi:MAG: chlorosome envelope protein B [Chlorobiaceae bacterium]|nr:chlorosome envelope protein B [Chlorobiaceae bacterium]
MANEMQTQETAGINTISDAVGKVAQMQMDLVSNVMTTSLEAFKSVNKFSMDLAVNAANALNQVLEGISAAVAPKK